MDEEVIRKEKPHSVTAEIGILSSMFQTREAVVAVADLLTKDDFYQTQYGIIFDAMVELYHEGTAVDLITVTERLKEKHVPESIYGVETLQQIMLYEPNPTNIQKYAKIVKDRSNLRQIIKMSDEISTDCYTLADNSQILLDKVSNKIGEIEASNSSEDVVPIKKIVGQVLRNIHEASKIEGSITGVPTGFFDLDEKLTGLHGSELILVAARPGMGKTAFALNIASHVLSKTDIPVVIFNFEMNREQIAQRMLAIDAQVDSHHMRTGNLQDDEWMKLYESSNFLMGTNLIIDDNANATIADIQNRCRTLKRKNNIGLIIIDYLQLMSGNGRSESRQNEVSEISRGLKVLAKELDVPVIALSQLSRAVEQRPDKRPMLSDLRESGAIEQDADVVMFIFRADKYKEDLPEEDRNKADIIIAKQRNGETGTIRLGWQGQYTKFVNLERSFKNNQNR